MEIDKENLHHAYLISAAWNDDLPQVVLGALAIERANNPDIHIFSGVLNVDNAREITEILSTRPFGDKRVVIVNGGEFNIYAQNALLKTIEEAPKGNHIFYVAPNDELVLPTLRSRMQRIALEQAEDLVNVKKFLSLTPAKRLDFAKKFKDSEKPLGPFLDELLSYLKDSRDIEKVFAMRRFADDGGSDARLILEHLSLVLK